eukprot:g19264.t1
MSDVPAAVRYEYVTREIGVPVCTLTAADCNARWRSLPQWRPLNGRRIQFQVPSLPDGGDNVMLQIPMPDGSKLEVPLPERCAEGDWLSLFQRADLSWKVVVKKKRFSFVVPKECQGGDVLTLSPSDQISLSFTIPENVEPYNVVTLAQEGDEWAFAQCAVLPPFSETPFQPDWTTGQYQQILNALKSKGYVDRLRPDPEGVLHVSVPFCGHFHEYVTLGNFLAESASAVPGVGKISVFGMELFDDYIRDWALAERYLWRKHGIECRVEQGDLAEEPIPTAQWVIGIHPEVTKGGPWFRIIGSLLRSCTGSKLFFDFRSTSLKLLIMVTCMPWNMPEMVQQVKLLFWRPSIPQVPVVPVKKIHHPRFEGGYNPELDTYDVRTAPKLDVVPEEVLRCKRRQIIALLGRVEAGGDQKMLDHYLKVADEHYAELQDGPRAMLAAFEAEFANDRKQWVFADFNSCGTETSTTCSETEEVASSQFLDVSRPRSEIEEEWTLVD